MRSFGRDKTEKLITDYVQSLFSDKTINEIKKYIKAHKKEINSLNEGNLQAIKKEISSLDVKIDNTINLLIDTQSEKLKIKLAELENRQKQLILEMEKLESSRMTDEKIESYIIRVKDFYKMDRTEKQFYTKKAIKKITAHKDGNFEIITTYSDVVDKVGGTTQTRTGGKGVADLCLTTWLWCLILFFSEKDA